MKSFVSTTVAAALTVLVCQETAAKRRFDKQSVLKEARPHLEVICADFAKLAYSLRASEERATNEKCLEGEKLPAESIASVMNGFVNDCTEVLVGKMSLTIGARKTTDLSISIRELAALFLKSYQPHFDAFCDKSSRTAESIVPSGPAPAAAVESGFAPVP